MKIQNIYKKYIKKLKTKLNILIITLTFLFQKNMI